MNDDALKSKMKLAHAYVPFQECPKLYSPCVALRRGTIFPDLDMPYVRCKR